MPAGLSPTLTGGLLLAAAWLLFQASLLLLHAAGAGVGPFVWPLSEDNNFLSLMYNFQGTHFHKAFWRLDGRNPLAPWWYSAVSPVLLHRSGYGFFLVRRAMDLACALAVLVVLQRLGRGRHPGFSFSCALLTMLWTFGPVSWNSIAWDRLGAACLSMLSLGAYCAYLDSGRREGRWLAAGLVLYFLAVATYTLQASALLGVPLLGAFRRPPEGAASGWRRRVLTACGDTALFGALLAGFWLVFTTTTPIGDVGAYCSASLLRGQLLPSLHRGVWQPDYTNLLQSALRNWPPLALAGAVAAAVVLVTVASRAVPGGGGLGACGPEPSSWPTLGWVLAVNGAIAAATVALESTSQAWPPGSRTCMFQQVTLPAFYLGLLFGLTALLPGARAWRGLARWAGTSAACALALVLSLEQVRQQRAITVGVQHALLQSVEPLLEEIAPSTNLVVLLDGPCQPYHAHEVVVLDVRFQPDLARDYVRRQVKGRGVNPVFVPRATALTPFLGTPPVVFGPEEVTLPQRQALAGTQVPYAEVVVARFDGLRARRVDRLDAAELAGFHAVITGKAPIVPGQVRPGTRAALR